MSRVTIAAVLLLAFAPVASADVIYQYTGNPFDLIGGNWIQFFGSDPTNVTATVVVADPFPASIYPGFPGGSVGTLQPGGCCGVGIISAYISDGVRTLPADRVYLAGSGTTIMYWDVGGGMLEGTSDSRSLDTQYLPIFNSGFAGGGDHSDDLIEIGLPGDPDFAVFELGASAPGPGQWTAVVTPETNTGALALISAALLSLGFWRKARKN